MIRVGGQFSNQHSLAPPLNPWVKLEVTPQTINPTDHGAGFGLKTPPKIFVTEPWCHKGNITFTRKVEPGCSMLPMDGWSGRHKQILCIIMYMPKCVQVAVFFASRYI